MERLPFPSLHPVPTPGAANASIALGALFPGLSVIGATEMSIAGAQALAQVRPWTLRVEVRRWTMGGGQGWSGHTSRRRVCGAVRFVRPYAPLHATSPHWQGEAEAVTLPILPPAPAGKNLSVSLAASEIRTFVLTLASS